MADNITLNAGSGGAVLDTDEIAGVHTQVIKVSFGATDSKTLVTTSAGLPVNLVADYATIVDDAAFTPGTTRVTMVGAEFDNVTPDSVDEGDAGALRMSANRSLYVNIRDNAGNERGLNIDAAGAIAVTDGAGSLTVDNAGTFATQATQSGTWNVTNISGTISLPTGASTLAEQQSQTTSLQLIDDTVYAVNGAISKALAIAGQLDDASTTAATENNVAPVRITAQRAMHANLRNDAGTEIGTSGAPVRTDPTGTTAQPITDNAGSLTVDNPILSVVGGGTEAAAQRVTIATDSTGVLSVDDNGGSLTVDNGGTFAVQDSEKITDNAAFTDGTSKVLMAGYAFDEVAGTGLTENDAGAARIDSKRAQVLVIEDETTRGRRVTVTAANALKVDASGVAVPITDNAGSLTVDNAGTFAVQATIAAGAAATAKAEDVASADADVGVPAMAVRKAAPANTSGTDGDYEMLQMSAGRLWVDPSGVTLTVASHAVTNAGTFAVQAASAGDVAHDGADTGNPVKIGAVARQTNPTAVADGDRVNTYADDLGRLVNYPFAPRDRIVKGPRISLTSTTETTLIAAGGAGVFRDLLWVLCSNESSSEVRVDFRDIAAGTVLFSIDLAADGGGAVVGLPICWPQATAASAWTAQLSTAVSTVYISGLAVENN